MSETERRLGYDNRRVLIETERVLDPQFDDAVLYITGGQLELLRNLMVYLRRQSTFVSEYHANDYFTPTVGEWDNLLAVVADLEEKLMGNENVIWGYRERWQENLEELEGVVAFDTLTTTPVPEGEVWILENASYKWKGSSCSILGLRLFQEEIGVRLQLQTTPVNDRWEMWNGSVTLGPGDYVEGGFWGLTAGDDIVLSVAGYKMDAA